MNQPQPPPSAYPASMTHSPSRRGEQHLPHLQQHDRLPTSDSFLDIPGPSSRRPSDGGTSGSSGSDVRYYSADEDRPERRLPDGIRPSNGPYQFPAAQQGQPSAGLRSPYQPTSATMVSSPSANSFNSPDRGRRAPAPAALDLSPQGTGQGSAWHDDRARNLVGLGYGPPPGARGIPGDERRVVTDSYVDRVSIPLACYCTS